MRLGGGGFGHFLKFRECFGHYLGFKGNSVLYLFLFFLFLWCIGLFLGIKCILDIFVVTRALWSFFRFIGLFRYSSSN